MNLKSNKMTTAKEYWFERFGTPPESDSDKLACAFAQEYATDVVIPEMKTVIIPSLPADRWDAEDFLIEKGISNHPRVSDCNDKESYEIADLMAEFANRYYGNES